MFAVYDGYGIRGRHDVATGLAATFSDVMAEWIADGELGHSPVIQPVHTTEAAGDTRNVARWLYYAVDNAPSGGLVEFVTTSSHVVKWATGQWKAKSDVALAVLATLTLACDKGVHIVFAS